MESVATVNQPKTIPTIIPEISQSILQTGRESVSLCLSMCRNPKIVPEIKIASHTINENWPLAIQHIGSLKIISSKNIKPSTINCNIVHQDNPCIVDLNDGVEFINCLCFSPPKNLSKIVMFNPIGKLIAKAHPIG